MVGSEFYNRVLAVEYAKKYAFVRNSNFSDFTQMGGNCTNFVSQCLLAGGAQQNYAYPFGWFYKNINSRSPSFTGVEYLYDFLTRKNAVPNSSIGPKAIECPIEYLQIGDIVQLSFDGIKFGHSLIVTALNQDDKHNPLLTTNTYDALNKPLSYYGFAAVRGLCIV